MAYLATAHLPRLKTVAPKITGVELHDLVPRRDARGVLVEIFRQQWTGIRPLQWNAVRSEPNVLRGVHAHRDHEDYLTVITGRVLFGLHDLRPNSPTYKISEMIEIDAEDPQGLVVPTGVAHGFYFPVASTMMYGVTDYWNGTDEFGCYFDAPELDLDWQADAPILSDTDQRLGSYQDFAAAMTSDDPAVMDRGRLKR